MSLLNRFVMGVCDVKFEVSEVVKFMHDEKERFCDSL